MSIYRQRKSVKTRLCGSDCKPATAPLTKRSFASMAVACWPLHGAFRSEQDAADAVQDAFLAAFKAIATFNGDSQLGTWLHRIVVNACLMRRRSLDRHPTVAIDSLLPEFDATGHHRQSVKSLRTSPADSLATEEFRRQMRECIHRLPAPYRDVLILRDIEELDTEATASALGISPGVVKTRLHRARHAIRTLLEPILQ